MSTIRLDRFLSEATGLSRRLAMQLVCRGHVTLQTPAGDATPPTLARDSSARIDPSVTAVFVDGVRTAPRGPVTLVMHKPAGVISATTDDHHRTVLDLVPSDLRSPALAPAGRLDLDTTGLLILTDDGDLNHRLTHPARHLPKRYVATLSAPLEAGAAERAAAGLVLGDGTRLKSSELKHLPPTSDGSPRISLVIHEGKYHQVKRMVAALGSAVVALHREAVGGLELPSDLAPGACRPLGAFELAALLGKTDPGA